MVSSLLALALAVAPGPAPVSVGPVPDETLVDQDGRPVRVVSELLRGRTVAVNFVFTTCTTICGPMAAVFGKLQDELGARYGKDIRLVSITLDPDTDTPQRLKSFAAKFKRREGWTLLTGSREKVRAVAKALGGWESEKMAHAPVVLLGNLDTGAWVRMDGFARPAALAQELERIDARAPRSGR
jgi:protein SCO1/2